MKHEISNIMYAIVHGPNGLSQGDSKCQYGLINNTNELTCTKQTKKNYTEFHGQSNPTP
jgi:hypothetical protein